jgi:hypothetical protein
MRIGFSDDAVEEQNWLLDTVSCESCNYFLFLFCFDCFYTVSGKNDTPMLFSRSFLNEMICYCCRPVCSCVLIVSCGQTVLGMNIRFGAKHAPFIRTSGTKTHPKIPPSSPLSWGERGRGMENVGKTH